MSFMDTNFADKLQAALKDTVAEFNDCRDPSEAVAKVACDYGFGASGTKRLLESFNRARTIYHFETSKEDKTAEFALAEPEQVFKHMHVTETKVASVDNIKEAELASDYTHVEKDYTASPEPELKSAAAAAVEPVFNKEASINRLLHIQSGLRRGIDAGVDAIGIEERKMDHCLDKVARAIVARSDSAESGNKMFLKVKEACSRTPSMGCIGDKLDEYMPPAYVLGSSEGVKYASVLETADIRDCMDLMTKAATSWNLVSQAKALKGSLESELVEVQSSIKSAAMVGDTEKKAESEGDSVASFFTKKADLYAAKPLSLDVSRTLSDTDERSKYKRTGKELTNLHRQLLLEDLMVTDPVLSKADPNQVISAYQNVMNLSPEIANQRATVIPILRQAIHAPDAFSPFDALQLTKLDQAIKRTAGKVPPLKVEENN